MAPIETSKGFVNNLFGRYRALIARDLSATYSRDTQKWLLLAPLVGVVVGIVITLITLAILNGTWAVLLPLYYAHHWMILPGLLIGFALTGLIMQYLTPDPNLHSTEEIIRSYHEHQGDIDVRPFWFKLVAAVTTVGTGGSAALEGPSIYGGGAIGSWMWTKLRRFGLETRDRRIMLISGAAAGMAAVFRAPLTGLVFALEMPYKDDLAHEALLPSLIASVAAYATLVTVMGSEPLFGFTGSSAFATGDLLWSAVLGVVCGLVAMAFVLTFRHARMLAVQSPIPHTWKLIIGGLGTALCAYIFLAFSDAPLMPLGPNYEAVRELLANHHDTAALLLFALTKLGATLFSLGSGGVSAMFVPLLLAGGALGAAFGQSLVHSPAVDLYAAVGMASFIAAGYKTPLVAVVFVAETTGGHSYIIPSLIGAAVAYAVSGEASASGDQRLHETVRLSELILCPIRAVMRREVVGVAASATVKEFADTVAAVNSHLSYPVFDGENAVGLISSTQLVTLAPGQWEATTVAQMASKDVVKINDDCDCDEALRLLSGAHAPHILLVTGSDGALVGIVTAMDIMRVIRQPPDQRQAAAG